MPTTMENQKGRVAQTRILTVILLSVVLHVASASSVHSLGDVRLDGAQVVQLQHGMEQASYILLPLHDVHDPTRQQKMSQTNAFALRGFSQRDFLTDVKESSITTRVVAASAAVPICLSLASQILINVGRHWNSWYVVFSGTVALIAAKLVAIPAGILLVLAGLVIGDLEISLIGIASLALLYSARLGSWTGAVRLVQLLWWAPDVISMERWHVKRPTQPLVVGSDDPFRRGQEAIAKIIDRAADEDWSSTLQWTDEVVIALLAAKFVCLTEDELNWTEGPQKPTIRALTTKLARWTKGWNGQPGKWVRDWTFFQAKGPASEPYETTLRFVIVLYECIMRSEYTGPRYAMKQKELLMHVLNGRRSGDMGWVYSLVRECLNDGGIERSGVGAL